MVILAGAGVRQHNVRSIVAGTGVTEVHGTCRGFVEGGMLYRPEGVYMGGERRNEPGIEYRWKQAQAHIVKEMVQVWYT